MKTKYSWLKLPIWILEIFTEAKSFEKNPVIGSRFLNLLGLHVFRLLCAHLLTAWRRFLLGFSVPRHYRKALKQNGYIQIDDVLDKTLFDELCREAGEPWPETRYFVQGDTTTEFLFLKEHYRQKMSACSRLFEQTPINKLMMYVAATGLMPWMDFLNIKNISGTKDGDPQKIFHSDTFHPTMKAWLFLEDVTPEKGPFEYISKSNQLTWGRIKWEYRNSIRSKTLDQDYARRGSLRVSEDETESMGYGAVKSFSVSKNTLVIADTFGFHRRGEASENSHRLSVAYSLRTNPFLLFPIPNIGAINRFIEGLVDKHYQSTTLIKKNSD